MCVRSHLRIIFTCAVVLCWSHISQETKPTYRNNQGSRTSSDDFTFPDELGANDVPNTQHFHHHNHHHPGFHHYHFHEHDTSEDYPEAGRPENVDPNVTTVQIPLEFIQNINKLDVDDVLKEYVEGADVKGIIQERFGEVEGQERKNSVVPQKAGCIPELRAVKIVESEDPSILYIPQCTRIERCGGCCSHSLLSCQPQETEYVNFEVFKTQFTGAKKLKALGKEIVTVEKHTKCKCDCRVKPENCSKFQEYKKSECRCVCTNYDEEKKCYRTNGRKLWNSDSCICQCRETMQCSTGSYFDQNECKCKMNQFSRPIRSELRSFLFKPTSVIASKQDFPIEKR